MKKIFALVLCLTMITALAACGGNGNSSTGSSAAAPTGTPEPATEPESSTESEPAAEGGKTLVVYYSYSSNISCNRNGTTVSNSKKADNS